MSQIVRDMFGNEVDLAELAKQPHKGTHKKRRSPIPRGYYYSPGTGPAGETCGSCKHIVRKQLGKVYLKCELNRARWTGGGGSDIRSRSPACKYWEPVEAAESGFKKAEGEAFLAHESGTCAVSATPAHTDSVPSIITPDPIKSTEHPGRGGEHMRVRG